MLNTLKRALNFKNCRSFIELKIYWTQYCCSYRPQAKVTYTSWGFLYSRWILISNPYIKLLISFTSSDVPIYCLPSDASDITQIQYTNTKIENKNFQWMYTQLNFDCVKSLEVQKNKSTYIHILTWKNWTYL